MSEEEVEPALTPEEWEEALQHGLSDSGEWNPEVFDWHNMVREFGPHGAAALLLYGFYSWEDVEALRIAATYCGDAYGPGSETERYESLADRIAALLPPRSEG